MPLTIILRFPTHRYVAASMTNRDELEWPPHPARLMLGLLASHYRSAGLPAQRQALQWLCEQSAPKLFLPPEDHCARETLAGVFVPSNTGSELTDKKKITKIRKYHYPAKRSFPSLVFPEDQALIAFHWPELEADHETRAALADLVNQLPRFGHSSSLVMGELAHSVPEQGEWESWIPVADDALESPELRLRVPWSGLLDSAEEVFAAQERQLELTAAFGRRDAAEAKGKPLAKFQASSRSRYDPRHRSAGYRRDAVPVHHQGPWEQHLFVLKRSDGDRLGLESAWQLTSVLHQTLLKRWSSNYSGTPVPAWISGHQPGPGTTAPSADCHLAILPLVNVAHAHADGRILGLGLAFPRAEVIGLTRPELRRQWREMLTALLAEGSISLTPADHAWRFQLIPDDGNSGRISLTSSLWTTSSHHWESVTPIILDRHPKPNFRQDPQRWAESCRQIIRQSCERLNLPAPISIRVSPYSALTGVPPAPAFPAPQARPGRPPRFHIHAALEFAEEVSGPVLLGAGRYRGYGLMKPAKPAPLP